MFFEAKGETFFKNEFFTPPTFVVFSRRLLFCFLFLFFHHREERVRKREREREREREFPMEFFSFVFFLSSNNLLGVVSSR